MVVIIFKRDLISFIPKKIKKKNIYQPLYFDYFFFRVAAMLIVATIAALLTLHRKHHDKAI